MLDDIGQGVYQAGQQIPTESELCTLYNVSRITIRKAISDLVKDGVLIRWQGKGTFVQSKKVENALLTVSGFTDFGVSQGKPTKEEVIEQTRVSADPFCERLNIPGGSEMFLLRRVMYLDGEPLFI
ncbi:GntR family transcriptional regulator, partial [Leptospira borgpetersenii serovar Hardjo-bovis]|nr:GntR family transcriptional regulator [Leptospira borgpetersenii serovar Hardjo-bovis]